MLTFIEEDAISTARPSSVNQPDKFQAEIFECIKQKQPFYLKRGLTKKDLDELFNKACRLHADEKYQEAIDLYQMMAVYDNRDKRGWFGAATCLKEIKQFFLCLNGLWNNGKT